MDICRLWLEESTPEKLKGESGRELLITE